MEQSRPSRPYHTDFSLQEYKSNPEVVKKANDAFVAYVETVLEDNELLREETKVIDRENLLLKERLRRNFRNSSYLSFFTFLAGVLISTGVGFITSSHNNSIISPGFILLVAGIAVTIFTFAFFLYMRPRGDNQ